MASMSRSWRGIVRAADVEKPLVAFEELGELERIVTSWSGD
jgi:hypothetical protein